MRACILVVAIEECLRRLQQATERTEGVVHAGGLVPGVHHAVSTARIAAFRAIVGPLNRVHEFLERIGVAILQQIAGLLPTEDRVCRHAPGSATQFLMTHEEFHEHGRRVELPALLPVRQNGAK